MSYKEIIEHYHKSDDKLNKSGESGWPWHVPDIRGKAFNSSFIILLAVALCTCILLVWERGLLLLTC